MRLAKYVWKAISCNSVKAQTLSVKEQSLFLPGVKEQSLSLPGVKEQSLSLPGVKEQSLSLPGVNCATDG